MSQTKIIGASIKRLDPETVAQRYANVEREFGAVFEVTASTAEVDRMGDIVEQVWDLSAFEENPVILQNHDHNAPVVGRAIGTSIDEGGNLRIDIEFDTDDTNPDGQRIASQFDRGFMRAVSVGFLPGSVTPRSKLPASDPRKAEFGFILGSKDAPNHLLELSAVSIPANPSALASKGFEVKHILSVDESEDTITVVYQKRELGIEEETSDDDTDDQFSRSLLEALRSNTEVRSEILGLIQAQKAIDEVKTAKGWCLTAEADPEEWIWGQ